MRRYALLLLLMCCVAGRGQLLSVTATLTDPDGTVWKNATCSVAVYSPRGNPHFGNTPIPTGPQACSVNGSGVLSASLYNTTTATPAGVQYTFQIQSNTSAPGNTFTIGVPAADMTSAISAQLTRPRFSATTAFTYGYVDAEAVAGPPGSIYYNLTTPSLKVWSGSAWGDVGGGGSGGCSSQGAAGTLQGSDGNGACVATGFVESGGPGGITFVADETKFFSNGTNQFTDIHNSSVTLNATDDSSADSLNFQATGFATFGLDYWRTGNGAGLPGVLGLLNAGTSAFVWNTNQSSDMCFGTTVAGNNVAGCVGAFAKIDHTGFMSIQGNNVPTVPGTATTGQTTCILAAGPPPTIGKCTSVVGSGGACTCASF